MKTVTSRPNIIVVLATLPSVLAYIIINYIATISYNIVYKTTREFVFLNQKCVKWFQSKTIKILVNIYYLFEKYIIMSCSNFIDNSIAKIENIFFGILHLMIFYFIIPIWKSFIWCNDKIFSLIYDAKNFIKNYLFLPIWLTIKYCFKKSKTFISNTYRFIKDDVVIPTYDIGLWFYHTLRKFIIDFYNNLIYLISEGKIIILNDIIQPFTNGIKWWLNMNDTKKIIL